MPKSNAKTVTKHLRKLADWLESDECAAEERATVAESFNEMIDNLHESDFFGTEGQLDPRGDQRNG